MYNLNYLSAILLFGFPLLFLIIYYYYYLKEKKFNITMPKYFKLIDTLNTKYHIVFFLSLTIFISAILFRRYYVIDVFVNAGYFEEIKYNVNLFNMEFVRVGWFIFSLIALLISTINLFKNKKSTNKIISYFFLVISSLLYEKWIYDSFVISQNKAANALAGPINTSSIITFSSFYIIFLTLLIFNIVNYFLVYFKKANQEF